jgi:hypothetical protein
MLEAPRRLTEHFWSEIGCKMFQWLEYKGDAMEAFYMDKTALMERGAMVSITSDEYDVNKIFISCELIPNTPSDKLQRVNQAAQIAQTFPTEFPRGELIEMLALGNADALKEERRREMVEEVAIQNYLQEKTARQNMMLQMEQMQMQMQMQQAQQQQMMQEQQAMQQGAVDQFGNAQGQGFNPAGGGIPPAMMNPEATRTMQEQTGQAGL